MSRDHNAFLPFADSTTTPPNTSPTSSKADGSVSQTSDFYVGPFYVGDATITAVAFSCPATGAPGGTATLEASCDVSANQMKGPQYPDYGLANWFDVIAEDAKTGALMTAAAAPISNATAICFVLKNHGFRWLRIRVTVSGGTMTPTVTVQNKRP